MPSIYASKEEREKEVECWEEGDADEQGEEWTKAVPVRWEGIEEVVEGRGESDSLEERNGQAGGLPPALCLLQIKKRERT